MTRPLPGNHRDSWSYGSLDPCSATATMMEMVRAFSQLRRHGEGSAVAGQIGDRRWLGISVPILAKRGWFMGSLYEEFYVCNSPELCTVNIKFSMLG